MAAYSRSRGLGGPPLKEGAIAGFASFVGGYIVTLVVVALGESDELTENLAQAAGWLYYNAQFASLQVTAQAGGQSRSSTFNYLTDSTLFSQSVDSVSVPTVVSHLIPIVVLVGTGVVLAGYVDARSKREPSLARRSQSAPSCRHCWARFCSRSNSLDSGSRSNKVPRSSKV
jgi:pheromone shutdown protein TraB